MWANDTLLGPHLDPLTILAAAAPVTERVVLGTAALLPPFRWPVQAAKQVASLDLLSGGRLVLGVGAGFPGRSELEYAASEVPWARRFARLDDTVALWRRLWAAAGLGRFVDAGARHIVLRIAAPDLGGQRDQLDRLADVLLGSRGPAALPRRRPAPVAG